MSYKRVRLLKGSGVAKKKIENKNNADFRFYIEVLECLYRSDIDSFLIASGDNDFTELILKLKKEGKYLIGVGNRENTNVEYVSLFNEFIFNDEMIERAQKKKDAIKLEEAKKKEEQLKLEEKKKQEKLEREQKMLELFKEELDKHLKELKAGEYKLSTLTSAVKQKNKNKFTEPISVEHYQKLGYEVKFKKENDKSSAYLEKILTKEEIKQNNIKEQERLKKAKETRIKNFIKKYEPALKEYLDTQPNGKYKLSDITSAVKSLHPKKFKLTVTKDIYERMGYTVIIEGEDNNNAFIILER